MKISVSAESAVISQWSADFSPLQNFTSQEKLKNQTSSIINMSCLSRMATADRQFCLPVFPFVYFVYLVVKKTPQKM